MQDLSRHFANDKDYCAWPPEDSGHQEFELSWGGEAWDGGANQLHLHRTDNKATSGDKALSCLARVAHEQGFVVKPNLERTSGEVDPDFIFFDLEGSGKFRPQEFVDRFVNLLYAA